MPHKPNEAAVVDFMQAIGLMVRRMRAASGADVLSMTESVVMARLEKDGPATTAELARAEGMMPQSMGATIASLESLGMVERTRHPTDGRQFHIALTEQGVTLRQSTGAAKRTWLAQAIAELDDADQDVLFKAGDIIRRLAEQ